MSDSRKYAQYLSPTAPTIIRKAGWKGQTAFRMLKKPRETELENIDICLHHCPHPDKCSGSKARMEKCRKDFKEKEEA